MGEVVGPDDPTQHAGTIEAETQSVYAWGLADVEDEPTPARVTPGRITAAAVTASMALVAVAGVLAWQHLRAEETPVAATETMVPAAATPVTTAPKPVAAPPKPPPAPPPVTITTVVVQAPPTTAVEMSPEHPGISAQQMAMYDQRFLARVRAQGLTIWDVGLSITRAHQVCALLYNGETVAQVKNRMVNEAMRDGGDVYGTANRLVDTAMATYPDCP